MMTMESVGERDSDAALTLTPNLAQAHENLSRAISALDGIVRLIERQGVILKSVPICRDGMHFTQGVGSRTAWFTCGIKFIAPSKLDPEAFDGKTNVLVAVSFTLKQSSESVEMSWPIHASSWSVEPRLQDHLLAEQLKTLASWEERRKWYTAHEIGETPFRADVARAERLIVALALRTQER